MAGGGTLKLRRIIMAPWLVLAGAAFASPTSPDLFLRGAEVLSLGAQRQLRVEGGFHYADLVQFGYPFQLVAYTEGGDFVRYDLSGAVYAGVAASLGASLNEDDVAALLAAGRPVAVDPVVSMTNRALDLRLPQGLPAGPLTIQIFVEYQGQTLFSNPVTTAPGDV